MTGRNRKLTRAGACLALLAAMLAFALFLVACGGDGEETNASPSASATGTWSEADLAAIEADPALKDALPSGMTEIRVASDIPYPPWEYYDPPTSKNPAGFDFDLSQALGKKIGVPVSFNAVPFDSIILSIKAGKNDMIMSCMYDNPEREGEGVSFVAYAEDGTSILVKKGNPEGLTDLDSLAGKTVACESGTTQQKLLEGLNKDFAAAGKPEMKIITLPKQPDALLAVTSGRAVCDVTDHTTALDIAETTNKGKTFEVLVDSEFPGGYDPTPVGIGILTKNTELIDVMQKALQALIDEGTYQRIVAKYGLGGVTSAEVNIATKGATP